MNVVVEHREFGIVRGIPDVGAGGFEVGIAQSLRAAEVVAPFVVSYS